MHEQSALTDDREDRAFRLFGSGQSTGRDRQPLIILQLGTIDRVDLHQTGEVDQTRYLEHVVGLQIEFVDQEIDHGLRRTALDFESNGTTESSSTQFEFDRLQQIVGVLVLDGEVGVARDAEDGDVTDRHAREQGVEVGFDHFLDRNEPVTARQGHEAGEHRGDLDPGETLLTVLGVDHVDGETQGQVRDVRERMRRIDGQWGENREDPLLVQIGAIRPLFGRQVGPATDTDTFAFELRNEHVEVHLLLTSDEFSHSRQHLGLLLGRCATVEQGRGDASRVLVLHGSDAHLEELVEVRREDRAELHSLEQRNAGLGRQTKDALVEVEPTEFAIEEARFHRCRVHRIHGRLPPRFTVNSPKDQTAVSDDFFVEAQIPLDRDVLALGVAHDALTIALELRIVEGQKDQTGQGAAAELLDQGAVAVVADDVPVRRHRAQEHDAHVGTGRFVGGVDLGHGNSLGVFIDFRPKADGCTGGKPLVTGTLPANVTGRNPRTVLRHEGLTGTRP